MRQEFPHRVLWPSSCTFPRRRTLKPRRDFDGKDWERTEKSKEIGRCEDAIGFEAPADRRFLAAIGNTPQHERAALHEPDAQHYVAVRAVAPKGGAEYLEFQLVPQTPERLPAPPPTAAFLLFRAPGRNSTVAAGCPIPL